MGSVSPLIAVMQQIKIEKPAAEFLFLGTKDGPEKAAVESYRLPFKPISGGKLRRYWSGQNFLDFFKIIAGFFQSLAIVFKFKPAAVLIAGSFVGVPAAWAAWLLRVPVVIHQQDVRAGLANKLMANCARKITLSFEFSLKDFSDKKTILTGNAVRGEFYDCEPARSKGIFNLKKDLPLVLILGGGTGAQIINQIAEKSLADLAQFCQIIHITGRGKTNSIKVNNYHQFDFLTNEMTEALCAADLVVSRAGMSTLSELIILGKPTILVPLTGHQEFNAQYFQKNNAAVVLSEAALNPEMLISTIKELLFDKAKRENLSRQMAQMMKLDGAKEVARVLLGEVK